MRRNRNSIWTNCALSIVVSAAVGIIVLILCMLLFAVFTYFFMDDMQFSGSFCKAALTAGGYAGGNLCGKFRRRKGLLEGIFCGSAMYLLLAAVGVIVCGGLPGIKKLLLLAVSCAAGGVVGVNSKRPKHLRD